MNGGVRVWEGGAWDRILTAHELRNGMETTHASLPLSAPGADVLPTSDLRPLVLLGHSHYHPEPHLRCHHRHLCSSQSRENQEGGETEEFMLHLWLVNNGVAMS